MFTISILNKYISNLFLEHFQILKKLYKYFLGARLVLKYIGILGVYIILGILLNGDIYLNTYSNLDWGRDEDNCCSIINYFFEIIGRVIFWISWRQKIILLFLMEVEYITLFEIIREFKWINIFIINFGFAV